jgi:hypothetical protein
MDDERVGSAQVYVGDAGGPAPGFVLGVGAVTALVTLVALHPLLVNLDGPFGEHAVLGLLAALAVALAAGAGVAVLARAVAKRSTVALVALVAGLAATAFVAFPTPVDRHESFVEQPNERSSCLGLTFSHYPPGTMDAASEVYCVGLERPLPTG